MNVRVYMLAKEMDLGNQTIMNQLEKMGYKAANHMALLSDHTVKVVRKYFANSSNLEAARATEKAEKERMAPPRRRKLHKSRRFSAQKVKTKPPSDKTARTSLTASFASVPNDIMRTRQDATKVSLGKTEGGLRWRLLRSWPLPKLAKELGLSRETVANQLRSMGYKVDNYATPVGGDAAEAIGRFYSKHENWEAAVRTSHQPTQRYKKPKSRSQGGASR